MKNLGRLSIKQNNICFLIIDVQERFIPVIDNINQVISNINILTKVSQILDFPLIVTEQYPKGLGNTTRKITLPKNTKIIEKLSFSCYGSPEFKNFLKESKIDTLIISGIETHVCVLQTVLDAIKNDVQVHLITDAISSRAKSNKDIAIERIKQSGAFISSTEMIVFQLLEKAGTDSFKTISKLFR